MRVFIACEINPQTKVKIASVQDEFKQTGADVKWVKPENIHITLKFLGEISSADVEKIEEAIKVAVNGFGDFRITFQDIGGFPNSKNPRVLWVGIVEGKERLIKLSEAISQELISYGFLSEKRDFIPHLTIGRLKLEKNRNKIGQKIEIYKNTNFGEELVNKVLIIESKLKSKGPCYSVLREIKLASKD